MKLFCFDLTKGSNKYIAAKYCKTAFICYWFFHIYFIYSIFIMFIELNFCQKRFNLFSLRPFCAAVFKREVTSTKKKRKEKKKDWDRRSGWLIYLSFLVFSSVHLGVSKTYTDMETGLNGKNQVVNLINLSITYLSF